MEVQNLILSRLLSLALALSIEVQVVQLVQSVQLCHPCQSTTTMEAEGQEEETEREGSSLACS